MWSFPIVSFVLGILFWKGEFTKKEILILSVGLCLQALSYRIGPTGPFLNSAPWLSLGKGLLLGVLWANFGVNVKKIPAKQRESIKYKMIFFSGLLFMTLTNQFGVKLSDGVLTCLFILLPAVFWTVRVERELKVTFTLFAIAILSFVSFVVQWTGLIHDWYHGNPLLWMLAFGSSFFLSFRMKDSIQ